MIPDAGLFKRGTPNHDNLSQLAWDYMAGDHLCIGRALGGDHNSWSQSWMSDHKSALSSKMISLMTYLHHNKTGGKASPPPPQQAFVHPDMESFRFQTHIYVTTIIINPPWLKPHSKELPPSGQGSPVNSVDISPVKKSLTHIFNLPLLHSFIAVENV